MNEKENYGFICLSMQYLEEKYLFFYVVFVSRENRKKMKESILFMANLLKWGYSLGSCKWPSCCLLGKKEGGKENFRVSDGKLGLEGL